MTYVVGPACIDVLDRSCIDVCPVDCIIEVEHMVVIDPLECIDCAACEPVCPVSAIVPAEALDPAERRFAALNAAVADSADAVSRLVTAYIEGRGRDAAEDPDGHLQ